MFLFGAGTGRAGPSAWQEAYWVYRAGWPPPDRSRKAGPSAVSRQVAEVEDGWVQGKRQAEMGSARGSWG